MNDIKDQRLLKSYEVLRNMFPAFLPPVEPPTNDEELRCNYLDLLNFSKRHFRSTNRGFPPGRWYLSTLTSKPTDTKAEVLANHQLVVSRLGSQIVHAVLEKSNILHIHYLLCLKNNKTHLDRDVTAQTSRIFQTEPQITCKKRWNGACKYVLKRDYPDKAHTQEEILIDGIEYVEKTGYIIKT